MKVLNLGKFYPIRGGVEKVMWDITRGVSARGIQCDMLCAMLPESAVDFKDRELIEPTDDGTTVLRFNSFGRVICLPAKKKVAATMICPAMIKWLRKHVREYDVVHLHHPDPMAALALRLCRFKGRVVLHWHSDILKQKKLLRLYKPLQRWIIRRADKIVGTTPIYVNESPWLADVQDKVDFIPIGVEKVCPNPELVERLRGRYPGKRIIYSLGRMVEYKGFEYLIRAAKYLPEEYMIVIGGQGPLRTALEEIAISQDLADRVSFLGWVEDDESYAWFGACDLFVLSSIMKTEAFAIVQVEAMSCGTPLVSTRIPGSGVAWVNKDGQSGLTVPICDPKAIADAILAIDASPEKHHEFSEGALARYEEMFTYDKMIDKCIKIYEG